MDHFLFLGKNIACSHILNGFRDLQDLSYIKLFSAVDRVSPVCDVFTVAISTTLERLKNLQIKFSDQK